MKHLLFLLLLLNFNTVLASDPCDPSTTDFNEATPCANNAEGYFFRSGSHTLSELIKNYKSADTTLTSSQASDLRDMIKDQVNLYAAKDNSIFNKWIYEGTWPPLDATPTAGEESLYMDAYAKALAFINFDNANKANYYKLLMKESVASSSWAAPISPTDPDHQNKLVTYIAQVNQTGYECSPQLNQCGESLGCVEFFPTTDNADKKDIGEICTSDNNCSSGNCSYGYCAPKYTCSCVPDGDEAPSQNACCSGRATLVQAEDENGNPELDANGRRISVYMCGNDDTPVTTHSLSLNEWKLSQVSCSVKVPPNDRIRYEENERILLAFEYLFADDPESEEDPFGHKAPIIQVAKQYRTSRVSAKQTADKALKVVYDKFKQSLRAFDSDDQGYNLSHNDTLQSDSSGLEYLTYLVQLIQAHQMKDEMMSQSVSTALINQLKEASSKIKKFRYSKNTKFKKNKCGYRFHHNKSCWRGGYELKGNDSSMQNFTYSTMVKDLRLNSTQQLDNYSLKPKLGIADPAIPNTIRNKTGFKKRSASINAFRKKKKKKKGVRFDLNATQVEKLLKVFQVDFEDYVSIKTEALTGNLTNFTRSYSLPKGTYKLNEDGFNTDSTFYSAKDKDFFLARRVALNSFLSYGRDKKRKNLAKGKTYYLSIIQSVLKEMILYYTHSADFRKQQVECLNARIERLRALLNNNATNDSTQTGFENVDNGGATLEGHNVDLGTVSDTMCPNGVCDSPNVNLTGHEVGDGAITTSYNPVGAHANALNGGAGNSDNLANGGGMHAEAKSNNAFGKQATSQGFGRNSSDASKVDASVSKDGLSGSNKNSFSNKFGSTASGGKNKNALSGTNGLSEAERLRLLNSRYKSSFGDTSASNLNGDNLALDENGNIKRRRGGSDEDGSGSEDANADAQQGTKYSALDLSNFGPRKSLNLNFGAGDNEEGAIDEGDIANGKSASANSQTGKEILENSKDPRFQGNERDSLWEKVTKAYIRSAYPTLLIKKKKK